MKSTYLIKVYKLTILTIVFIKGVRYRAKFLYIKNYAYNNVHWQEPFLLLCDYPFKVMKYKSQFSRSKACSGANSYSQFIMLWTQRHTASKRFNCKRNKCKWLLIYPTRWSSLLLIVQFFRFCRNAAERSLSKIFEVAINRFLTIKSFNMIETGFASMNHKFKDYTNWTKVYVIPI